MAEPRPEDFVHELMEGICTGWFVVAQATCDGFMAPRTKERCTKRWGTVAWKPTLRGLIDEGAFHGHTHRIALRWARRLIAEGRLPVEVNDG